MLVQLAQPQRRIQLSIILLFATFIVATREKVIGSDQIPGTPQKKPIAIVGAVVHTVSDETIENGSVLLVDGKIAAVGKGISIPSEAERIDAAGKHVYPGFIDAHTPMGLIEIESVRATIDNRETGNINPNVRAALAFNPDSELIPVARANGLLLAVSAPSGGLISGRSSLMMMDGWTWEDMTLKADTGMHINWPRVPAPNSSRTGPASGSDLKLLDEVFDQAQRYRNARKSDTNTASDARLEALGLVLEKKIPVVASATTLAQIQSAVAFAKKWELRLIIYGGYDATACADLLVREKVPVILAGVYRLPIRSSDAYDAAYTLPQRLKEAKIQFCISSAGRFGASNLRNLPYHAATAAAYGLSESDALRAITLSPAEILGAADRVGSISAGKDATLFIADGNILEPPTQVTHAFIQGRKVDLNNRHLQLYRKYSEKYERLRTN